MDVKRVVGSRFDAAPVYEAVQMYRHDGKASEQWMRVGVICVEGDDMSFTTVPYDRWSGSEDAPIYLGSSLLFIGALPDGCDEDYWLFEHVVYATEYEDLTLDTLLNNRPSNAYLTTDDVERYWRHMSDTDSP